MLDFSLALVPGRVSQGDVRQVLASWPNNCADLIIADPAYGLGKADWDIRPDYGQWLLDALRVLKTTGTAYIFGLPEVIAAHWTSFPAPKRLLTWAVSNRVSPACKTWQPTQEAIVMLTKDRPFFDREAVREPFTADYARHKGKTRPATPGRFGSRATSYSSAAGALPRDVLRGPGLSGRVGARESLGHPCQKPLWLMERLIRASAPPDGLVLDLFAGAATASLAAHRLCRHWIAVERDPHWCQVALERLRREGAQASLSVFQDPSQELRAWKVSIEKELAGLKEVVAQLRGGLPDGHTSV